MRHLPGHPCRHAQLVADQDRRSTVINLGMPTFNQIAARTMDTKGPAS
ncbi:hypothetical protein ACWC9T_37505 [Kitasatospora sp. NPDC001159]